VLLQLLLRDVFTDPFSGPDPNEVQHAKELCESLLENVKEQYARFKENPPQQRGYGYQQGGQQGGGERQGYGGGYGGYGGAQSPAAATPATPGPPGASSPTDYSAQYAQYYGGQDPYAAYGGYQNYVAYYQYYTQQAAQQQGAGAAPGSAPPAPPADDAPPPPPPSGSPPAANGGYNSVSFAGLLRSQDIRLGGMLWLTRQFLGSATSRNVRRRWEGENKIDSGGNGLRWSIHFTHLPPRFRFVLYRHASRDGKTFGRTAIMDTGFVTMQQDVARYRMNRGL